MTSSADVTGPVDALRVFKEKRQIRQMDYEKTIAELDTKLDEIRSKKEKIQLEWKAAEAKDEAELQKLQENTDEVLRSMKSRKRPMKPKEESENDEDDRVTGGIEQGLDEHEKKQRKLLDFKNAKIPELTNEEIIRKLEEKKWNATQIVRETGLGRAKAAKLAKKDMAGTGTNCRRILSIVLHDTEVDSKNKRNADENEGSSQEPGKEDEKRLEANDG